MSSDFNKIKVDLNKNNCIVSFVMNNIETRAGRETSDSSVGQRSASNPATRWIDRLSDEDLSFVKRFVLASGSLKAIAAEYRITYPTVRLRLDRLIAKIQVFDSERITSEFERQVRALYADGRIDLETMKRLLDLHRQEIQTLSEEQP